MTARPSSVPLAEEVREELAKLLEDALANTIAVYLQAKTAHWNIRGPRFMFLHELFDKVVEKVEAYADPIAERIGQLGYPARSGLPKRVVQASLATSMDDSFQPEDYFIETVREMLVKMSALTHSSRDRADELGDAVTADLLTDFIRDLDQMTWFVGSHLEGEIRKK